MKFYITIKNRIAEVLSDGGQLPYVVCDNTEGSITFLFDGEWEEHAEKTARFVYREDMGKGPLVYVDVAFTGDSVAIPLLHNVSEVFVGVFAGGLMTTSAARLACIPSVYGFSADPVGTVGTETKTVSLDLSEGDQIVAASLGKTMTAVIIERPETLVPENIRAGVTVAGVVGTYGKGITAPEIYRAGLGVVICAVSDADLYDVHVVAPDGSDRLVSVLQIEGENRYLECEEFFSEGENTVYAVARNSTTGVISPESERLVFSYKPSEDYLNAPVISLDGSVLTVTETGGSVEVSSYKVFITEGATELGMTLFEGTSFDLALIPNLEGGKTYTVTVKAYDVYTETHSPASNAVSYTRTATDSGEDGSGEGGSGEDAEGLDAPAVSIDGTKLTIYAVEGATSYEVHRITTVDTVIRTLSINESTWIDIKGNLAEGENKIYVVAKNTATGQTSQRSETLRVYYSGTEVDVLMPPTISISGDVLTVTAGQGTKPTSYDLYVGGESWYTTASTVIDLKETLASLAPGTYLLWVRACLEETGLQSEASNTLTYVKSDTYTLWMQSPSLPTEIRYAVNGDLYDLLDGGGTVWSPGTDDVTIEGLKQTDYVLLYVSGSYQFDGVVGDMLYERLYYGDHAKLLKLTFDKNESGVNMDAIFGVVSTESGSTDPDYSGYTLDVRETSVSGKEVRYLLNSRFYESDFMDGNYLGSISLSSDAQCIDGLKASDELYILIVDAENVRIDVEYFEGCTVTYLVTDSTGAFYKITDFSEGARVDFSVERVE